MPPSTKKMREKRNKRIAIGVGVTSFAVILIILGVTLSPLSPFATTTTTTTNTSTIKLVSYVDREDVSNFVKVDIWVPKSTAEFDDQLDVTTLSNYELLGTTKAAEDISVDFTDYEYVIIEIDPDGETVFANDFYIITGGANYAYTLNVYHLASDVNFNMLNILTMDEVSVSGYQTDGNYTILFDIPHHTTTNIHANDDPNWYITEDDWDDMSTTDKEYYWNEENFRCEPTLYDPSVDTIQSADDYELKFSGITSCFAFKMTFNDSIGDYDSVTGLNVTIDDTKVNGDVYRIDSGSTMYLAFDSTIKFSSGIQEIGLELEFGANITLSTMYSGRLTIPRHIYDTTGLAFSALSAIGA